MDHSDAQAVEMFSCKEGSQGGSGGAAVAAMGLGGREPQQPEVQRPLQQGAELEDYSLSIFSLLQHTWESNWPG